MSKNTTLSTPKYRLHKAKGLAVVTIKGRDVYLGKYNSAASKEQYRRLVAEYLTTGAEPGGNPQNEITVAEILAAFVRHAKGYYVKNGKLTREYGKVVESGRVVNKLYGRSLAIDFGPIALEAVRQAMIDAGQTRKYINSSVDRIRRIFKWAASKEMIPASVPQALSMLAGLKKNRTTAKESDPVLPVDDSIVETTLEFMPEVPADMVRFQRATGCRPGEVCELRPCDLDRTGDVWQYRPESHKTEHHGKARVILCGPKAQAILLKYLARDPETYCFRPCDSEEKRLATRRANRTTPLSCGNKPGSNRKSKPKRQAGDCYTTCNYRRAIYRGCEKAGVERWAPNRLRHTAATEIRREFGLEAAQVILGHSAADVTQVYAERDMAKGAEVARRIG